jgi:hypothetical protein
LAELDHPRILKIFELIVDEDEEKIYLVTEYAPRFSPCKPTVTSHWVSV